MLNPNNVVRLQGYEYLRVDPTAFGEVPDAAARIGQAQLFALTDGALVASANFSVQDMALFGVKIHTAMLDPGTYRIVLRMNGRELAGDMNVQRRPNALATQVQNDLRQHGTPIIFFGYCDSSMYPYGEDTNAWFDRPDAKARVEDMHISGKIDDAQREMLLQFIDEGYIIIKNAIPQELVDGVNAELDHVIATQYYNYEYGSSNRIEGMHKFYPRTQELWLSEDWRKYVDLIFQERSLPCQTLAYIFGSEQAAHQDTIHLTPYPRGYMCGIWIALQDVIQESGELEFFPSSHMEEPVRSSCLKTGKVNNHDYIKFAGEVEAIFQDIAYKYQSVAYYPLKGDVLIWNENLLHGGKPRLRKETERRSIVIHTFAENSVVFYDSTGIPGFVANLNESV
jgi:hypothetical protein